MIIVSASDDNFVPGLLNLLYSTLFHNKDAEFYIIDAGLSAMRLTSATCECAPTLP